MTLPVHWWPARLPDVHDGVFVIGLRGDGDRVAARAAIRVALREALAQLSGLAPEDIDIDSIPGNAPVAALASGTDRMRTAQRFPGIAITHDGCLSLAAINLGGPVGIDLMQVVETPDLRAVARDYLGPAVAASLDACPAANRAGAFARAWTEREARLKCLGLPLTEWSASASEREARCRCTGIDLPDGFAGTLALLHGGQGWRLPSAQ